MTYRLEKITYVYDEDPGPIGKELRKASGVLEFGAEGSGLLDVHAELTGDDPWQVGRRVVPIPLQMKKASELSALMRDLVGEGLPCMVGHCGDHTEIVVSAESLKRSNGTLSDIRGKIRYGAARLDWFIDKS